MFFKGNGKFFLLPAFLVTVGYMLMVFDPVENGFGLLTLWIAPPLLLAGFLMPIFGIERLGINVLDRWRENPAKHIAGCLVFFFSFSVYLLTLEPTASLWDCSEFIACAYKLQVPHTPGTPLSLLIGRLFSMLAFGDVSKVAWTVNCMSALFSALSVWLVYRIIYYFAAELLVEGKYRNLILTLAACTGSLCLAFSDTFWFSAVEAETYGAASFFLLLIVWLILSGRELEEPFRTRRLILILYLSGLSYCIHPMCLLALPILPFAWSTFDKKITVTRSLLLIAAGLATVFLVNRLVAVGVFELAFAFDLFFVNILHFPFNSGAVFLVLLSVFIVQTLLKRFTATRRYVWSLVFLVLGFTPYLLLFIRSNHNPPIDENNPENLALIKAYMNRESYPTAPLLYGPYFDSHIRDVKVKKKIYFKDKSEYRVAGILPEYVFDSRQTFLPRMYDNDADKISAYRSWTSLQDGEKPTFLDNMGFMFSYQLGHMYFRYLMWNFAGRESDVQNSRWLKPWERVGNSGFQRARNQYWMIPFLLGVTGAIFQFGRKIKGFVALAVFFLITGVILAIYLNSPPNEPRERDYIFVGSFIAFSIWIGLGLVPLAAYTLKLRWMGATILVASSLGTPIWMLLENFDDHNRAGRTFQVDNARNTLASCAPNSILFTGGDNDTFPLWYLQEIEGFRTDVRVMVLSYMNTDWYINQLRKSYYDSGAFRLTLGEKDYRQYGPNDVLYVHETIPGPISVIQFLGLLKNEHPGLRILLSNGEPYHILPSRQLVVDIPSSMVTPAKNATRHTVTGKQLTLNIAEDYLSKNLLAVLDVIVSNGLERPVYFNFTSLNSLGVDLAAYVVQEGPVFRLTGDKGEPDRIRVDTALAYKNLIEDSDYSNLADPAIHFSYEDHFARMVVPIRQEFNDLARAYLNEGTTQMALTVLRTAVDKLYKPHLPPSYTNIEAAEILLGLSENELADTLSLAAFNYYYEIVNAEREGIGTSTKLDKYLLRRAAELLTATGHREYIEQLSREGF